MEPNFNQFSALSKRILSLYKTVPEGYILSEKESIFSKNAKTGYSVNFPISLTCRPSKICSQVCYASRLGAPINWKASLLKQFRVYNYIQQTNQKVVAQRVISEYHKKNLSWLRWCGSGDLFKKATGVINLITELDPSLKQLVVTRKPEMANLLVKDAKSLYIMFSLDSSCLDRKLKLQPNSRIFYSYLRVSANDDVSNTQVIFNEQKQKHILPHDKVRCCPVDSGKLPLRDGCNKCKKCFSETIFSPEDS